MRIWVLWGVALWTQTCPEPWGWWPHDAWMPTRFSWFGFPLTGSLKFLIVFWKEANSSSHFFMCRLLPIFSHRHVLRYVYYKPPCMLGETERHFKSAPWSDWSVFCALWPWPFPSFQGVLRGSRACFFQHFYWHWESGPESDRWKDTWREQVFAPCFHFALTGGAEM